MGGDPCENQTKFFLQSVTMTSKNRIRPLAVLCGNTGMLVGVSGCKREHARRTAGREFVFIVFL